MKYSAAIAVTSGEVVKERECEVTKNYALPSPMYKKGTGKRCNCHFHT